MSNRPALTASDVQKMVVACKGEATKNKWNVSIAVVDDAGYLLYLERLDGAGPVTAEVATEKAATAARTRPPHQVLGGPRQGTALVHQVPGQPADSGRRAHHVSERVRRRDRRVRGSVSRGRAICQRGGRRARLEGSPRPTESLRAVRRPAARRRASDRGSASGRSECCVRVAGCRCARRGSRRDGSAACTNQWAGGRPASSRHR